MNDVKHVGMSSHRLQPNPLEKAFADEWNRQNDRGNTLAYLLSPDNRVERTTMTERDAIVAATVIQWLGSPVGQGFLESVKEASQ